MLVELGAVSSMSPPSAVVDRTQFHAAHCLDRNCSSSCEIPVFWIRGAGQLLFKLANSETLKKGQLTH